MANFRLVLLISTTLYIVEALPVSRSSLFPNDAIDKAKWPGEVLDLMRNGRQFTIKKFFNDAKADIDSDNVADNDDDNVDDDDRDASKTKPKKEPPQTLKGPQTEEEEDQEEAAELNPNLFEGDLKFSKEDIDELDKNTVSKKDTVAAAERKWPNARVPIVLDATFDESRKAVLVQAIREFHTKTCVKFVAKGPADSDFIRFTVNQGCYSTSVGKNRQGGEQEISIGEGCNFPGTVIHEMMHAIGFFHEHTRLDRDQYVTINWNSIEKGRETQFKKYPHGEGDYLGEPYDYDSVMHYPRDGFGVLINGKRLSTLVPKDKAWRKIGQRNGFSKIDLNQINKMYNCRIAS